MIDYVLDWKPRRSVKHSYIWARYGKYEGMLRKLICRRICTCKQFSLLLKLCKGIEKRKADCFSLVSETAVWRADKGLFQKGMSLTESTVRSLKMNTGDVLWWENVNSYLMLEQGTDSTSVHLSWCPESCTHAEFAICRYAEKYDPSSNDYYE